MAVRAPWPREGDHAVAYAILAAARHTLTTGELYVDPGGDYILRRDLERTTIGLSRNSKSSGTQSFSNPPPKRLLLRS